MSLTTYAGLVASLTSWGTYQDTTDALAADFIYWAHQEINRRLRANVLLASTTLTLSAETISQPTGFLALKRVYLDTTPRRALQTIDAAGAMELSVEYSSDTYPSHVAVEGSLLRFAPLFTGTTTTATCLYYKEAVLMTADGDTNVVLTKYPYLYLFGALEALHVYHEDAEEAADFGQKFGALIEDINAREAKDVMSGPIQMQQAPGGVV